MKKAQKSSPFKKEGQELQDYLQFQRRASRIENKKKYSRKIKHKNQDKFKYAA